ncbi:hypothetical protein OROHE_023356 [Orobanche hederae]
MTICRPSNDSFSADAMSQLMKSRLHSGARPLASIPAAGKEKKIVMMRSRGSEDVLYFHYLLPQAQPEFRETLSLPFSDNKARPPFPEMGRRICCGECRGLLHFDTRDGDIFVCNPTTAQFSIFPRPPKESHRDVITVFKPSGFGYDHTSDDYKIVRIFWHSYSYTKTSAQVYSFKRKSWEEIVSPLLDTSIGVFDYESGAYVSGKYYWSYVKPSSAGILSFDFAGILSFNFATDTFETSPAPKSDDIIDCFYRFVELEDGKLGAILREKPEASRVSTRVEVWAFEKDGSWVRRFDATLDNVVRSLGLKHGLLFLEGKRSSENLSQLLVYDLAAKKLEWLEIYDKFKTMEIFSYSESTYILPDAKPMDGSTCLFDGDDDDDEIEDTSDGETDNDDDGGE